MHSHQSWPQSTHSIPSSLYSTPSSHGLPSEEYQALQRRHTRQRLESHFVHTGTPTKYTSPRTAYQSADMPPPKRSHISAMQNATRRALGPSFDFTQPGFEALAQRQRDAASAEQAAREQLSGVGYDEPVPRRYVDAFNKKWAEDDDRYDSTQAYADRVPAAAWRQHANLPDGIVPDDPYATRRRGAPGKRAGAMGEDGGRVVVEDGGRRPNLVSKFSADSDLSEAIPRRSMFGLRR